MPSAFLPLYPVTMACCHLPSFLATIEAESIKRPFGDHDVAISVLSKDRQMVQINSVK